MKGRKKIRTAAVFAFAAIAVCALSLQSADAEAGARLKVDPVASDCGEVPEGSPASAEIVLENEGDADLAIKNVRTN